MYDCMYVCMYACMDPMHSHTTVVVTRIVGVKVQTISHCDFTELKVCGVMRLN